MGAIDGGWLSSVAPLVGAFGVGWTEAGFTLPSWPAPASTLPSASRNDHVLASGSTRISPKAVFKPMAEPSVTWVNSVVGCLAPLRKISEEGPAGAGVEEGSSIWSRKAWGEATWSSTSSLPTWSLRPSGRVSADFAGKISPASAKRPRRQRVGISIHINIRKRALRQDAAAKTNQCLPYGRLQKFRFSAGSEKRRPKERRHYRWRWTRR